MRDIDPAFQAHLDSGATTICRLWQIIRSDGSHLNFTDHDKDITFQNETFNAESGLTASALQLSSGLSVDNSQASGALSSDQINEEDIRQGLFDNAKIIIWNVNWKDSNQSLKIFEGFLGEIKRSDNAFEVEVKGITDPLNKPVGRVYSKTCQHVLGDSRCSVDLENSEFSRVLTVEAVLGQNQVFANGAEDLETHAFSNGHCVWLSGDNETRHSQITYSQKQSNGHQITFWLDLPNEIKVGDTVKCYVGCDRSAGSCKSKFSNLINFGGFPYIPGEDWITAYPNSGSDFDGSSLFGGLPDE